jgi:hypothetical protein
MPDPGPKWAGDLRRVSALLDQLGEELAGDSEIVKRHGPALQGLDISVQLIAVLEAIAAQGREFDEAPLKLEALRKSADQALQPNV